MLMMMIEEEERLSCQHRMSFLIPFILCLNFAYRRCSFKYLVHSCTGRMAQLISIFSLSFLFLFFPLQFQYFIPVQYSVLLPILLHLMWDTLQKIICIPHAYKDVVKEIRNHRQKGHEGHICTSTASIFVYLKCK